MNKKNKYPKKLDKKTKALRVLKKAVEDLNFYKSIVDQIATVIWNDDADHAYSSMVEDIREIYSKNYIA